MLFNANLFYKYVALVRPGLKFSSGQQAVVAAYSLYGRGAAIKHRAQEVVPDTAQHKAAIALVAEYLLQSPHRNHAPVR